MGSSLSIGSFQVELVEPKKAQAIEPPGNVPGSENPQIGGLVIKALKGNKGTVYVGGLGVTEAAGYPLEPGETLPIDVMGLGGAEFIGPNAKDSVAVCWVGP